MSLPAARGTRSRKGATLQRWCLVGCQCLVGLLLVACGARSRPPAADGGVDAGVDADADADGDGDGGPCLDEDGDAFGEGPGCAADCDDADPALTDDCGAAPHCAEGRHVTGCPCEDGAAEACYFGPDGTGSQGECDAGVRVCLGGHWQLCEGQRWPRTEECNELDDDCDGEIDEECPPCWRSRYECFGPDRDCSVWGQAPGLAETAEGFLTVAEGQDAAAWTGVVHAGCVTNGPRALFDAEGFPGAEIEIEYRLAASEIELAETPWVPLGEIPPDGPTLPLDGAGDFDVWAELRTMLFRRDSTVPTVRRVDLCWDCEF